MSDLKSNLQGILDELKKVEERARKLENQNLADIVSSAHGKIKQLCDHPDLELADEKKDAVDSEARDEDDEAVNRAPPPPSRGPFSKAQQF
jgi:hypothetical protein